MNFFNNPKRPPAEPKKVRLIMGYKNFAAQKGISHIGLGVSGLNTTKVLQKNGITAEVVPLRTVDDLYRYLEKDRSITWPGHVRVSHVVISAPWIETRDFRHLCEIFPDVHFAVLSHSNVGFLQADPKGMRLIREAADLQLYYPNFHLAGNCPEFALWIKKSYERPCELLPNLYNLDNDKVPKKSRFDGRVLRIGCFGAVRPLKNTMTAAAAALQLSTEYDVPTEFWISSNRVEGGAGCVVEAIKEMLAGTKCILKTNPWQPWPEFREFMKTLHLHLQTSYTESFNITVADAISVGVPSVVSTAIDWAPKSWLADSDDVEDVVRVGKSLLQRPNTAIEGILALQKYIADGLEEWKEFLGLEKDKDKDRGKGKGRD